MLSCFLNLSPKQLACILLLVSFSVYLHLWYAYYMLGFANDLSNFLIQSKRRFRKTMFISSQPKDTKYILHWTDYYLLLENGRSIFPNLKCAVKNCVFTKDRTLVGGNYSYFDAVMFDDDFLTHEEDKWSGLPKYRTEKQLYIFTTLESAFYKPACELYNDDFYNWTATYRLDSTVMWNYFVVRNATGHIVAPSKDVIWETNTRAPVSRYVKKILLGKNKAGVWLVSHCNALSYRDEYLSDLQEHLYHYSLHVDVFGYCTGKVCKGTKCDEIIKDNYYFYMAFENSLSEDYVTEKVLHGYKNYAIPIVYGGANYSRFLPEGSYINARKMDPYILATKMKQIIDDPNLHESYFKWRSSYSVSPDGIHPLCTLCELLNKKPLPKSPAIKDFRRWWNGGPDGMKWCLSEAFWNETGIVNFDRPYVNNINSIRSKVFEQREGRETLDY